MSTIINIAGPSEDGTTMGNTSTIPMGMHGLYAAQASHIANPLSTYSTTLTTTTEVVGLAAMSVAIAGILTALENKGILAKS